MFGNVKAGSYDENQGEYVAPYFEIDPVFCTVIVCHVGIQGRHEHAIDNPGRTQSLPIGIRQIDLTPEHGFQEIFLEKKLRNKQSQCHAAVEQGWLEFDETIVVQNQSQGAKDQDQNQGDLLKGGQFAIQSIHQKALHQSSSHQHRSSLIDAGVFVSCEKKQDGK